MYETPYHLNIHKASTTQYCIGEGIILPLARSCYEWKWIFQRNQPSHALYAKNHLSGEKVFLGTKGYILLRNQLSLALCAINHISGNKILQCTKGYMMMINASIALFVKLNFHQILNS